jgi:hypothetical protein
MTLKSKEEENHYLQLSVARPGAVSLLPLQV